MTAEDDRPVGRILSRREVLALLSRSGGALLAACVPGGGAALTAGPGATVPPATTAASAATASGTTAAALPSCIVRPALSEGPFFVDGKLDRSDVRSDPATGAVSAGVPLALTFAVSRVATGGCRPLDGAQVDIWQCDAFGVYSDVAGALGKKFLRGFQRTDPSGRASFTTVYPGWYPGRAVHIHFKIRANVGGSAVGEFTSQLFFDEAVTDQVYAQAPYTQRPGSGRTLNSADGIFRGGGDKLLLRPAPSATGYAATFDIGLAS